MNLSLGLKTIAKRFPGFPAIEWEGGTLTYSEFECQVSELALFQTNISLNNIGLQSNQRLLRSKNGLHHAPSQTDRLA